jgi:hypothetical protein
MGFLSKAFKKVKPELNGTIKHRVKWAKVFLERVASKAVSNQKINQAKQECRHQAEFLAHCERLSKEKPQSQ